MVIAGHAPTKDGPEIETPTDVLGVDAVKGPCAVSIFSVLCVLLVMVIMNRVGGGC